MSRRHLVFRPAGGIRRAPLDPGRELNGRLRPEVRSQQGHWPGVPCSRNSSFEPSRKARGGLAPGSDDWSFFWERHVMPLYEHVYLARQDVTRSEEHTSELQSP